MSALPNPLHTQKKAPAIAARPTKLNKYGRDPLSPSEKLRASSDYDTEKGYAPFFHGFLADLPRLTSGNSCTLLILTLLSRSLGRGAKKGEPRPEWTLALSLEDLAQICCCDVRTIQRELSALEARGLAEIKRPVVGKVEARLNYRDWESLPNYKSQVVEMSAPDETVDPETVDDSKPGNQRVTGRKPVRLAAGAISKAFPVSCGVKTFRHKAEGPVDMEFTCVVQAGELLVVSRFPDDWLEKVKNALSTSNVSNDLTSQERHGCHGPARESKTPDYKPESKTKAIDYTHPRAAELIKLFDPILAKSASRLLSGDSASLKAACEAVADCDHDFLVKFAVQRAERPVKSPLHVKTICAEALASWKASKVLTGAGLPDETQRAIAEIAAKERAKRYGRGKV
jgi:hypothetical protein